MINAIQIALAGLNTASRQVGKAAATIAAPSALSGLTAAPPAGKPLPVLAPGATLPDADTLTGALIDLKTASLLYKANLKTMQAVSDMQKNLLKI